MNKHTPYPWHIRNGNEFYIYRETQTIASVEKEADAKLIAAAPEMFTALEQIIKECDYCEDGFIEYQPSGIDGYLPTGDANFVTEPCFYCASARAAIAKATGK